MGFHHFFINMGFSHFYTKLVYSNLEFCCEGFGFMKLEKNGL
jgi:hypothetical protein